MGFTGAAVVEQVADNLVRVSGIGLDNSAAGTASGTIGLFEKDVAPDVRLPAGFKPRPYDLPDLSPIVSLQDSISVMLTWVSNSAGGTRPDVAVEKTGTTPDDFAINIATPTNSETGGDLGSFELYIRFH